MAAGRTIINFEEVNSAFYYDETSPSCLRWKIEYSDKRIGDIVGFINNKRWVIYYNKKHMMINRIVWTLHYGELNASEVRLFYKDGNSLNNSIANLTNTKASQFNSKDTLPTDRVFCVYEHRDSNNNLLYIGSGVTNKRPYDKTARCKEHLDIFDSMIITILKDNLTKEESILLEKELINTNKDVLKFNKNSPSLTKKIIFEDISKLLYYDETSPTCLRWKVERYNTYGGKITSIGDIAGNLNKNGYVRVCANKTEYLGHRLVWCLCSGKDLISNLVIDHIDQDKSNNKINNLRLVTWSANAFNKALDKNNKSGVSGVFWCRNTLVWISVNKHNGKNFNKTFNPKYLYPDLPPEEAKQMAFEDAVSYREKFLEYVGVK